MYKIGIIGHSAEHFTDSDNVRSIIERTIELLGYQYKKDQLIFSIVGETGVGLWAAQLSFDLGYKYHMFLPYPLEQTHQHWYDDQKNSLVKYCNSAYSLTTCRADSSEEDMAHKLLIDESNFTICFWIGKKQGKTYDAIKHAHKSNKLILNGLEELKLITNLDTKKRKF